MSDIIKTIDQAFNQINELKPQNLPEQTKAAITAVMQQLDQGLLRVAEKQNGSWVTHDWIKKAILLYFKTTPNQCMPGFSQFYDKVPLKYNNQTEAQLKQGGVRIVPPACVRYGAHIAPQTVLMPCYVNLGAYIDSGCMIDTWATIGSCAQIGKNVHISGGAGIGGVLEPLQANPTIIEDNCFIGARSEIVEGVIVEDHAVISMGVFIGQSTPIYNRMTDEVSFGRIPTGAVVIPGSLPAKNGRYHSAAAIIVKQVDEKTRAKVSINEILRSEYA